MRTYFIELLSPLVGPAVAGVLVPSWFVMAGAAALVAAIVALRRARAAGDDTDAVLGACAVAYVAALGAGIAVPALYDVAGSVLAGRGFRLRWAGMVSWCGYLAGAAAVIIYLRRRGRSLSPARFADLVAPGLGLSMICARLGCFIAGCDYGQVTDSALAIRFPAGSPAHSAHVAAGWLPAYREASLPVHPTQLYEAALGLVLAIACVVVARTAWARRGEGRVFAALLAGYAVGRIAIESLRGDAGRGFVGPLSSAQLWSLIMLAALGGYVLYRLRSRSLAIAAAAALTITAGSGLAGAEEPRDEPTVAVGAYLTAAAPINRRAEQVPPLTGLSATATYLVSPGFRAGFDLDGLANKVASHGSLLAIAAIDLRRSGKLAVTSRVGVGTVLFNFRDPSFTDQVGLGGRAGVSIEYALGERWALAFRPLDLDLSTAAEIGPIFTIQSRVGLVYRHRAARAPAPAPARVPAPEPVPAPAPVPTPAPAPAPEQPINPYGPG